jgi:diguanylate cyclase (GGDEF)-like protein/PAS domain S-box-containing protein
MSKPLHVLIIEDNDDDVQVLLNELRQGGYEPTHERVDTPAALGAALARGAWDVVISEYALPGFDGLAALALLKESGHDIPFMIVSGEVSDNTTGVVLRAGVKECMRPDQLARLTPAVERELEAAATRVALRRAEARYQMLVEQVPAGIHTMALDAEGSTLFISPPLERILGFTLAEWQANPRLWREHLHPDDRERVLAEVSRMYTPGAEPFLSEYRMLTRDGHVVWLRDEMVIVRDASGNPQYLQSIKLNITERKQAEAQAQSINAKLSVWVNELEQHNREISLINELSNQLQTCVTIEEAQAIIGEFAQVIFPGEAGALYLHTPSRTHVETIVAWGEVLPSEQVFAVEECWALRRGRMYIISEPHSAQVCAHLGAVSTAYLCVPMVAQGEALGLLHLQKRAMADNGQDYSLESKQQLVLTFAELIALGLANLKLRETLRLQSSRDTLTGLGNRRYLEEVLERELRRAARKENPLGLILIDLDDFKTFKAAHGHEAGDALLKEVGACLQRQRQGDEAVCRLGGEEFALFLPEASFEVTQQRAEALYTELTHLSLEHRGQTLNGVVISLGVAVFPSDGDSAEALMRAAMMALQRAKAERGEIVTSLPTAEASASTEAESGDLTVGDLCLNRRTFELMIGERAIRPTPIEFELLQFLMSRAGDVFTAEQLLQEVWHYPPNTGSRELVRAHIKNLRGKIEPDPKHPTYIKTIGRFGYTIPR